MTANQGDKRYGTCVVKDTKRLYGLVFFYLITYIVHCLNYYLMFVKSFHLKSEYSLRRQKISSRLYTYLILSKLVHNVHYNLSYSKK